MNKNKMKSVKQVVIGMLLLGSVNVAYAQTTDSTKQSQPTDQAKQQDNNALVKEAIAYQDKQDWNNALATWSDPRSTTLWLDDFGSGNAGISAIRGYHFDYVKIDKDFFWHLMQKDSGRPLMDALITFLSRNHHNVIIEGVESEAHKKWLQGMEWFAIQGHYWKEVSIEQLVKEDIKV